MKSKDDEMTQTEDEQEQSSTDEEENSQADDDGELDETKRFERSDNLRRRSEWFQKRTGGR